MLQKDYDHPDGNVRQFGIYATEIPKAKTNLIRPDLQEVAGVDWFTVDDIVQQMSVIPSKLVPLITSAWPETFWAIWPETQQALYGKDKRRQR